ncbi:MAG: GbsR/MarR family transcriptional regulator [Gemmatimonadales bacterium]|jgi:DNA-binding transcriptional regulator GbsR (MarR family)
MAFTAEADGFTRIGGRLFGLLLLSERPRSLDDLARALGVSKASVSTDARHLLDRGVLERVARPGDRRDYYQIAPDFFARLMEHRVARWQRFRELVGELERRLRRPSPAVRARLHHVDEVHDQLARRMDAALRAWRRRERQRAPRRERA